MMQRDECFRALARHVTDEIVVATYSSAVDWLALGERTLNYFSIGAMGLDSSHALGLALGRPDKRIICLRSEEHTSELQSLAYLVCRLLLEKKKYRGRCGSPRCCAVRRSPWAASGLRCTSSSAAK